MVSAAPPPTQYQIDQILIALEEKKQQPVREAEQLVKAMEKNPALRHEMQLKAQHKFEAQRRFTFQQMQDLELQHISCMSLCRSMATNKQFWAWRKQAKSEMDQLQEADRLSRERLEQDTDTVISSPGTYPAQLNINGRSHLYSSLFCLDDSASTLPITTMAAFALEHPYTLEDMSWFRYGTKKSALASRQPPGKAYSLCGMSQIHCKPEHYRWLQKGLDLRFMSGSIS